MSDNLTGERSRNSLNFSYTILRHLVLFIFNCDSFKTVSKLSKMYLPTKIKILLNFCLIFQISSFSKFCSHFAVVTFFLVCSGVFISYVVI